jgi:hypothetical protein
MKDVCAREIVMADKVTTHEFCSEQARLNWIAASPLGILAGFEVKGISDLSVAELSERYGFPVARRLLYLRKLCRNMVSNEIRRHE